MFKNIFLKSLYSLRWQLVGWSLALVGISLLTMALYTSFSQTGIEELVDSVPDSLKSLVGSVADFKTIPGYIGQQIFGPNTIILTIIMAILLFISIGAREEENGSLQSLLSFPVSRTSVYFQKLLAVSLVIGLVCLSLVIGIWGGLLIVGESTNYADVFMSIFAAWLVSTAYGLVAYATAMATGKKGLTVALASGYAFVSFVISSLAPAVDKLKVIDKFSIFHYYNNPQIMSNGLNGEHAVVLVIIIVALTLGGWLGFLRRDVRS